MTTFQWLQAWNPMLIFSCLQQNKLFFRNFKQTLSKLFLSFFFSLIAKRNRWPDKSEEKSNFKGYKVPLEKSKEPSRIVSQDVGFFMWISVVSVAILSRRFMCARNVSQLVYCGFTLGLAVVQRRSFEPREATLKVGAFSTTPKFKISSHLSSR